MDDPVENADSHARKRGLSTGQAKQLMKEKELVMEEVVMKYGAEHMVMLFKPVSITLCVALIVTLMHNSTQYAHSTARKTMVNNDAKGESMPGGSAVIAILFIITTIAVMTFIAVFCLKNCSKVFMCFIIVQLSWISFLVETLLLQTLFGCANIAVDWFTGTLLILNLSVPSLCALFWQGPTILEQTFLVIMTGTLGVHFAISVSSTIVWIVLLLLAAWDMFAVLSPYGPLNIMLKTMQEKDMKLGKVKGLVYSAGLVFTAGVKIHTLNTIQQTPVVSAEIPFDNNTRIHVLRTSDIEQQQSPEVSVENEDKEEVEIVRVEQDEDDGRIKLGLGDFIFYSVLISRAALDAHAVTIVGCFVSVLVGLALTLILLVIYKRALPALPFSLVAGVIFYYLGENYMTPFLHEMNFNQIIV